ncbi:hypothetical protein CY0110_01080 [Crocosphaera chwakensis CCY0110]|uniref:DUF4351 domain-containing protein n=1 Tax=Crocosphaera chwakensis CCY0110 TaxID=391612 RepID=A3IXK1_9CHRO|nr:hypothetical protein CY0110_01080 [Crocosphaera chwakensis CCY0110]
MKESVIYQAIKAEGKEEGRQEGEVNLILRLLNRRFGQISPDFLTQVQTLSVEELEDLGEALLDFHSEEDLRQWFLKK